MSSFPPPPLIDVDCNLFHKDLKSLQDSDNDDPLIVLQEDAVSESNIKAMLTPSSTLSEATRGLEVLRSYAGQVVLKTTVGIHPYHVQDDELVGLKPKDAARTCIEMAQADQNKNLVVAIGECGLDASEGFPPLEAQLPWFQAQVEAAVEVGLPLFVHERLAHDECLRILQGCNVPVIIHCFTGTVVECQTYVERGYYLSLSGYVVKEEAGEPLRQCLRDGLIPLDKLMIETDAPYMGFTGCRQAYAEKNSDFVASLNSKKRKRLLSTMYPNLPSALPQVLDSVLASLNEGRRERGEDELTATELALQTSKNANDFFSFELDLEQSQS